MADKQLNTVLVLRNDETSAWESSQRILKKGELGLEYQEDGTVKIKAGNDADVFSDLSYIGSDVKHAKVIKVTLDENDTDDIAAIEAKIAEMNVEPSIGDVAIVQAGLAGDATAYTSYVYDGSTWVATSGNYSANNVFLQEDITLAGEYTRVGNLTKSTVNSTATFAVKGISVADAFKKMLTVTLQPKITANPAVTTKLDGKTGDIALEVGTLFTPSYSASLSAGSYTYGPATGISAKTWSISDSDGHTSTSASGSFTAFTVNDDTSYKVSATATYDAGAVAVDNLGGASDPTIQIGAGSKSDDSGIVTGYRSWFYGYIAPNETESNLIDVSQLSGKDNEAYATTKFRSEAFTKTNASFPTSLTTDKMQQIFFAAPKGLVSGIEVKNSKNDAPQTITHITDVYIQGANSHEAIAYDVFYANNAGAESGTTEFTVVRK